jgi:hypothetical protein
LFSLTVVEVKAIVLHPTQHMNHLFVQCIHGVYTIHLLVIQYLSTFMVLQCLRRLIVA